MRYNPLMTNLNPISLDHDWRYFPMEVMDEAYGASELDESSWGVLPDLADYPRDVIAFYGSLNLHHTFDLEPIEEICLRFHLHLTIAPAGTQVYINGWHVGTAQSGKPLLSDVTDFVTLEGNVLLLKLARKGDLRGLTLHPVPCEDQPL
ncbi:MAG: hypothetical protein R3E39_27230 [Anaerolineae bacterium]